MRILITGGSGFIGTNYVDLLLRAKDADFINLDREPPRNVEHQKLWHECDILDANRLKNIIADFAPTHIVHLAAKTGVHQTDIKEFSANFEGVENLISAVEGSASVERVIFTSSLLVCKMGYIPKNDTDYMPSTAYGESKVRGEEVVRQKNDLPFAWTIVRPISIWGPWGYEPYRNFFKSVAQGWYFHIGSGHYKRSLGYVENTVHQIQRILLAPIEAIDNKTFYLADEEPADLFDMANMIRQAVGSGDIHSIPVWFAKLAAVLGDVCKTAGWHNVPISSFRLNNITTEYVYDLSPIVNIAAPLPFDIESGVQRTVQWLKDAGEI